MVGNFDLFSRKAGFNTALRHFKFTTALVKSISDGINIADLLNNAEQEGSITRQQMPPIISSLLVDKFEYSFASRNITRMIESADEIIPAFKDWTDLQIALVYHHPEVGSFIINPRDKNSWEPALPILKDELITVYIQSLSGSLSDEQLNQALKDVHGVLAGFDVSERPEYRAKASAARSAAPKPAPAAQAAPARGKPRDGSYRITPRYSVVVTNELFHNGNVEAWKRIVASYRSTYPELDVLIYYDNERIKDINSLFKWGKVKHGTPIMISVAGSTIKDVSKLQRYLFEGASPRFESFLKGSIDQPLELF